jgi:hypothetical protein
MKFALRTKIFTHFLTPKNCFFFDVKVKVFAVAKGPDSEMIRPHATTNHVNRRRCRCPAPQLAHSQRQCHDLGAELHHPSWYFLWRPKEGLLPLHEHVSTLYLLTPVFALQDLHATANLFERRIASICLRRFTTLLQCSTNFFEYEDA